MKTLIPILKLCVILSVMLSLQALTTVNNATELESAIRAANAGSETLIEFGASFSYDQHFQPLNADNVLQPTNQTFIIDGKGFTLTQTGTSPGFFIRESGGTVTLQNLTIDGAQAIGGNSAGGGGGLGAGGALFLNAGSSVVLDSVVLENCRAVGGASSAPSAVTSGAGGGGLREGNGGSGDTSGSDCGGGGGGGFAGQGGVGGRYTGAGGGGFGGRGGSGAGDGGGGGGGGGFVGGTGGTGSSAGGGGGAGDGANGADGTASTAGRGGNGSGQGLGGAAGTGLGAGGGSGASGDAGGLPGANGPRGAGASSPGGGGGGGKEEDGQTGTGGLGGSGGSGFGGGGGGRSAAGLAGTGGDGGFGGGGGGGGGNQQGGSGGNGGFGGGGGGGGGNNSHNSIGGRGGFGGGGGGFGGSGGFGAGGGSYSGAAGFAGGSGGNAQSGGAGGALGGAIFIQDGANLTIRSSISLSDNSAIGGAGSSADRNGQAFGNDIFMMSGSTITFNLSSDVSIDSDIQSDQGAGGGVGGGLRKTGAAKLELSGANSYTGGTTLSAGEIVIGNNAALGTDAVAMSTDTILSLGSGISASNAINLEDGASGRVNVPAGTGILSGIIDGTNSILVKTGAGNLSISGVNTYSGGTILVDGILSIAAENNLGDSGGALTFNGGSLQTTAAFASARDATLTAAGTIEVLGDSLTMSGVVRGAGNLIKTGTGILTLSGANTYSGGTTLSTGEIVIRNNAGLGIGSANMSDGTILSLGSGITASNVINLEDGATGEVNVASGTGTLSWIITGENSVLAKTGTGALVLSGVNTYSGGTTFSAGEIVIGNNAALGTGAVAMSTDTIFSLNNGTIINDIDLDDSATGTINITSGAVEWSGVITGTDSVLSKTGTGILSLSGVNTYSGGTTFAAGAIAVGNNAALGTGILNMSNGTTLSLNSGITAGNAINFIGSTTGNANINVSAGTGTLSGVITGASATLNKIGAGILSFSGVNTYSGGTTLSAGAIAVGNNAALGTGILNMSNGTTLSLNSGITSGNAINFADSATGDVNVNVSAGTGTLSGVITGASATLTKIGIGILVLSGDNTYSGGTALSTGEISLGHSRALGIGALNMSNGTTLSLTSSGATSNAINFIPSATASINIVAETGALSGVITGDNSILVKSGAGMLVLSGVNTYTGGTNISDGMVVVDNNAALGTGAISMSTGTTLVLSNDITANNAMNFADSAVGNVSVSSGTGTLSGVITGDKSTLVKSGVGMLVLSGGNTYSGGTTLLTGTLSVAADINLGNSLGALVFNGGMLRSTEEFSSARDVTLTGSGTIEVLGDSLNMSGIFSGDGGLTKTGDGLLALSRTNTYSGGTTLVRGEVLLSNSAALGTGAVTIQDGSILSLDSGIIVVNDMNLSLSSRGNINVAEGTGALLGVIAGIDSLLVKTGSGVLSLYGDNTYSGGTTLVSGRILVGNNAALGTGAIAMSDGTTLSLDSDIIARNPINFADGATGNINTSSGTVTLLGAISGANSILSKSGAGVLVLAGINDYSGETTLLEGILSVAEDSNLGNPLGALTFNGGNLRTTAAFSSLRDTILRESGTIEVLGDSLTMSGMFSGAGALTKTGAGIFTLSGDNTYSGGTTLSVGELVVGNSAALGTGAATMSVDTTLSLASGIVANNDINFADSTTGSINVSLGTGTLSGVITGADSILAKVGAGVLTLSGVNTYNGGTTLFAGALDVGNDGALGAGAVSMSSGTTLSLASGITISNAVNLASASTSNVQVSSGTGTVLGVISGTDSVFAKTGAGVLALSGDNTYSGGTTLVNGTIVVGNSAALGAGAVSMSSGTTLSLVSGVTASNIIHFDSKATGSINVSTGTGTLSGAISGANSVLIKTGIGLLALSGDNTYSGGTTLSAGELSLGHNGALGSGPVTMRGGTTLSLSNGFAASNAINFDSEATGNINVATGIGTLSGVITGTTATLIKAGGGILALSGDNTYSGGTILSTGELSLGHNGALGSGPVNMRDATTLSIGSGITASNPIHLDPSATGSIKVAGGAGTLSGVIDGENSVLIKTGVGLLALSGDNTYSGGTTLVAGEISLGHNGALGSGPVTMRAETTLSLGSGITANNVINLDPSAIANINVADGIGTLSGIINGENSVLAKGGTGVLALYGDNTYSGGTVLFSGEIFVDNNEAFGSGPVTMGDATTLSLASGITASNPIHLIPLSTGSIKVAAGAGTLSGVIDGENSVLIKTGIGLLTLSGESTYNGGTILADGILSVAADNNLGNSGPLTFNGGTLQTTAAFSSAKGSILTESATIEVLGDSLTMSGIFSGVGTLTKTGIGLLALSGDNTYSGGTILSIGEISVANNAALGTEAVAMRGGTTLSLNSGIIASNAINLEGTATGRVKVTSGTGTLSGEIRGVNSFLVKDGAGVLVLSGDNAYSGGTTLSAGEVVAANNTALGTGAVTMQDGTTLFLVSGVAASNPIHLPSGATGSIKVAAGTGALSGLISGANSILTKTGVGLLALSGDNTYSGGTTLVNGILSVAADHHLGNSLGALTFNGGTLRSTEEFTSSRDATLIGAGTIDVAGASLTMTGIFSGPGVLTKTGAGMLSLSQTNTHSGGTTLSAGEIFVGNSAALGTGTVNMKDATTLSLNSGIIVSNNINLKDAATGRVNVVAGTGTLSGVISGVDSVLAKTGAGVLALSQGNTHSGGTTLSAGEIFVGNSAALGTGAATMADGTTLSLASGIIASNDINLEDVATGSIHVVGGTGTLSGIISGIDSVLAKTGDGVLALSGGNTYTGGTTLSAGELFVGNSAALGTGAATMADGTTLSLASGITAHNAITLPSSGRGNVNIVAGTGTLSGVISGIDSVLAKTGAGMLSISGDNTYGKGTMLNEGEIAVGNNGALGTAAVTMQNGTTLSLASGVAVHNDIYLPPEARGSINVSAEEGTLSGVISGTNSILSKTGAGVLALSGINTYSGGTTLVTGILSVAADNNLGNSLGTLTFNGGTLRSTEEFTSSRDATLIGAGTIEVLGDSLAMSGIISGAGNLTKTGTGMLSLPEGNTYSGGTTLAEGEIVAGNNAALGTGAIAMSDATTLSLDSGITVSNVINLDPTATGSVKIASGTGTLSGVISGGALAKRGSGVLALSESNTYSGGTTLAEGEIVVGNSAALGTGVAIMSDGTTLSLASDVTADNDINLDPTGLSSINVALGTGTLSGVISGGALAKMGEGKLVLSGDNTYTGDTWINGGILAFANANEVGAGTIHLNGGILESLGTATFTSDIDFTGAEEIEVKSGTLTLSGKITGNELVKTGMGTLFLTGEANYSGLSTINAGILELSAATTLGSGKGLLINNGSFLIARDSGTKTIGTLNGGGSGINLNNNRLEVGSGSFAGDISGTGGGLTKTSDGTLTLSGNNTFTGDLLINQGTVQVSTENNLGMGNVVLDGGTLASVATMTIDQVVSVIASSQIMVANETNMTVAGIMRGTSNLTKVGSGRMSFIGDGAAFTGTTTVKAGSLHVQAALGGPVIVLPSATLGGTGSVGDVQNQGIVIPGASIGTLSITGDYTQDALASLVIEIEDDPLSSDLLLITGDAHLDGSIVLNPLPGTYSPGMVFTFLQAKTINGAFSHLLETHPLDFELNYLKDSVQIIIPRGQAILPMPISELNGNARNVAEYLFSCPLRDLSEELVTVIRSLVKTSPENFPGALRQLGPQQFGSLAFSNLQTSARVGLSMNQTSTVYENYYLPSVDESSTDAAFGPDWSIWFNPIGYYYKHNEVEEQIPFNNVTYGFTTGFRARFFNHLIVSAGTGYTRSRLNWLPNNGDAHIQSVYLSPSIGYVGECGYAGLVFLGSHSFYGVNRKIYFSTFRDTAHNDHKSYDLLAGFRGSLKLQLPKNFQNNLFFLPTINIDYLNIFESGYKESGAGPLNLSVKNMHSAFLRPEVTFKLLQEWNTPCGCSSPSIYIGWLKNIPLTNASYTSRLYTQEACEKNFTVQSYNRSTGQLVLGAEVLVTYKARSSFKLGYEANIGNYYSVHEGKLNFNWTF